MVESTLNHLNGNSSRWSGLTFAVQKQQRGTADAVNSAYEYLKDFDGPIVVLAGDQPMTKRDTIQTLLRIWFQSAGQSQPIACLIGTVERDNPFGFGRILRDKQGNFTGIVEEKDATEQQKQIKEVNVSYYVFNAADLWWALKQVQPNNAQGEYYLTDCPAALLKAGRTVTAVKCLHAIESYSINTAEQLTEIESLIP